jgi:hypothetical protein
MQQLLEYDGFYVAESCVTYVHIGCHVNSSTDIFYFT